MRYHALAADYDGTLAYEGRVDAETLDALRKVRDSGRKLLLVTGRELEELLGIFPEIDLFDRIVAENGALVYNPATKEIRTLTEQPPREFAELLQKRGVAPLSVGHVIVATFQPHQTTVLDAIQELGLELHVIFNKDAVMVLPSGVNKATGLTVALAELGLSPHNAVGVGDAENDHAFLALCECGAAVDNALPALKERADIVLRGKRGSGVQELIEQLLDDDLASVVLPRRRVRLGERDGGGEVSLDAAGGGVMVCGTSGSGKSTLTAGLLERLAADGYQFAVIDPEGDYQSLEIAVALGSPQRAPLVDEVLDVLKDPPENVTVNLLGVALEHRPGFFDQLLPRLLEIRTRTGRPHWLVIDEAHHLMPSGRGPTPALPEGQRGILTITVHPESVDPAVLAGVQTVLVIGDAPGETLRRFADAASISPPDLPKMDKLDTGDTLVWHRGEERATLVHTEPPKAERKRHSRKYAEGNLGAERSFYFRGPDERLNLKAQNLFLFLQMADGVDDATWEFHKEKGDYSNWFRDKVKDEALADEVAAIEANGTLDSQASRVAIRQAVESRYTLPADRASGIQ